MCGKAAQIRLQHALIVLLLAGCAANAHAQTANDLIKKYQWPSIYLTAIPLQDLRVLLNTQGKADELERIHGWQAVKLLKTFLTQFSDVPANRSVAFVEIDLNMKRAGYKRADDPTGVIIPLAWSEEDVLKIAALCDQHLSGLDRIRSLRQRIAVSLGDLKSLFVETKETLSNIAHVSERSAFLLLDDLRHVKEKRPMELAQLKKDDPSLYRETEEISWQALRKDHGLYLNMFISLFPDGEHRKEAESRLDTLRNNPAIEIPDKVPEIRKPKKSPQTRKPKSQ